jgi:hypothetical protein
MTKYAHFWGLSEWIELADIHQCYTYCSSHGTTIDHYQEGMAEDYDVDLFEDFDEDRDPYSDDDMSYGSNMLGMGFHTPFWL